MFSVTSTASQEILAAASRSDAADMALRVAARQGPDGSVEYGMGFDEPREGDLPLQVQGVNLVIAPPSQPLLQDIVLDFVESSRASSTSSSHPNPKWPRSRPRPAATVAAAAARPSFHARGQP